MWIHLLNGRAFHFGDCDRCQYEDNGKSLVLYGKRNLYIATFRLETVAGWFYDNVDVTTYTATDNVEQLT